MPTSPTTAAELLAGPRGRRVCWELSTDLAFDSATVLAALQRAVDAAMYWEPPDDDDLCLRSADWLGRLRPVAERLLGLAATAWWATPLDLDRQRRIDLGASGPIRALAPVRDRLRAWRAAEDERNRTFREARLTHPEGYAITSDSWWSVPDRWNAVVTSRDLAPHGPVGLWLLEDFPGADDASSRPVFPPPGARVFEVSGPEALADLVRRHPLDVSDSRQPDWRRATDRTGRWLIPDWLSVADEFDAVHLSVLGYLTCAGRPIPIEDDAATLLAGWAPDEAHWLTDDIRIGEPESYWRRDGSDWTRTA